MNTLYLDASVLLRILFNEPGERPSLMSGTVAVASRIIEVETFRAVDRTRLSGHLDDARTARKLKELIDMLSRLHLAPVSDKVIQRARATFPIQVRALDAIHVATAEVLQEEVGPLEFWTHDARQASAALSRGLDVLGFSTAL